MYENVIMKPLLLHDEYFLVLVFLVVLVFELRALCLLARCSDT
jgi:hypothetical protein